MSKMNKVEDRAAFTVGEFLEWSRISRSKFYGEVGAKRICVRKLGKRTLILRTDAEAWLHALPASE